MKTISILYLGIFLFFVSSCSLTKKLEKKLIGRYAVEMLKSNINDDSSDAYESLLKGLLKDSYIQFNDNKTYVFKFANKELNGSWYFSEDCKSILTDKKDIKFSIEKFTETGLNLKSFNKNDEILMILKKINE